MTKIVYIDHEGTSRAIEVTPNMTVMEGAVRNNVPGIEAECGGACSCATCHVYVEESWLDKLAAPTAIEKAMLDFAENVMPNSRLSCQIKVTDALDGMTVTTPEHQS